MKKLLMALSLLLVTTAAMAVPAKPGLWRTITLSNGQQVRVQMVGDEHGHWLQDAQGACYVNNNGTYETADLQELQERRMARIAARKAPRQAITASTADGLGAFGTMSMGAVPSIGEYTIPVVMVQFSDLKFKNTTTVEKMTRYYNEEGYHDEELSVGSVRDYFIEQSGGQFVPTFEVVGIVTLSKSYKYYGQNDYQGSDKNVDELPKDVIAAAVEQLGADFSPYVVPAGDSNHHDGVPLLAMFYAGRGEATENYGDNYLWPCEWDAEEDPIGGGDYAGVHFNSFFIGNELASGGGSLMGMGVFCHEFGHALGLPDFYCTNGSYSNDDPFGLWSIMDSGAYADDDSRAPSAYNAYEKSYLGWLDLPELNYEQSEVVLASPEGLGVGSAVIVRNSNTETFILSNHQPSTFFSEYYGAGVLVIRVAYSQSAWNNNTLNNTKSKKRACVLTADGKTMYYSASRTNLYGVSKTTIGSLKTYSGSTLDMGIKKVTVNDDGTITLALNEQSGDDPDEPDDPTPVEPTPEGALFHESFNDCSGKGGNDGQWSGNIANATLTTDNTGWESENAYGAYKCAKFGTGKKDGLATSPAFTVNGEATLTFRAGAWYAAGDGNVLTVSVPEGFTVTAEDVTRGSATNEVELTMVKGEFTDYKLTISGTGNPRLTFAAQKGRFFLDEVLVMPVGGTETGISNVNANANVNPNAQHSTLNAQHWFTLDGRMLPGEPTQKGVYIYKGKKVKK
ncbi:MAG: M6 family metalloprotease domain-containing protein [Prevotella sp.]|nr:M6 family metalloprotease domain-containing protein [Prevotella sp.]